MQSCGASRRTHRARAKKCSLHHLTVCASLPEAALRAGARPQAPAPFFRRRGAGVGPGGAGRSRGLSGGGPGAVRGGREALGRRRAAAGLGAEAVWEEALRAMEELGWLAARLGAAWLAMVLALIVLPSALGVSLGISEAYMWVLVKTLEVGGWAASRRPFLRSVRGVKVPLVPLRALAEGGCPLSGARLGHAARRGAKSARHHFVAWEWGWGGGREEMAAGGAPSSWAGGRAAPPW